MKLLQRLDLPPLIILDRSQWCAVAPSPVAAPNSQRPPALLNLWHIVLFLLAQLNLNLPRLGEALHPVQAIAWLHLATPLARLTCAALLFECGKLAASLLAPELGAWGVTL